MINEFKILTKCSSQFIDITAQVAAMVRDVGVQSGVCFVFVPHTTAGVTINENADPNVVIDILKEIDKIVPWEDSYKHVEGNSAAHIKASMMGFSQAIFVENGKLVLGTWQGLYFCEFDGPRNRKVLVKIIGDKH